MVGLGVCPGGVDVRGGVVDVVVHGILVTPCRHRCVDRCSTKHSQTLITIITITITIIRSRTRINRSSG